MKRIAFAAVSMGLFATVAATPVYNARNVEVSSDAIRCREAGVPTVEDDVFLRQGFWKFANHGNLLKITVGGEYDGVKGLHVQGPAKRCDTAWNAKSGKIMLKGAGRRFRFGFFAKTSKYNLKLRTNEGKSWQSFIIWQDANGKTIGKSDRIMFSLAKGPQCEVSMTGDIPQGAVSFFMSFGFDYPNVDQGDAVVFSGFTFEELDDKKACAKEGVFVSEVCKGGAVKWMADCPKGSAVRFQWRGTSNVEKLSSMPFVGPDGTDKTYFEAPFSADAAFMQYRVKLTSDGCATPVLREVSVGDKVNRRWTLDGDLRPPRVRRESPSPTLNTSETLRISIKENESFVLWDSLKVVVDGIDRTSGFKREGDLISLAVSPGTWTQGVHVAEVHVSDFHGNRTKSRKMFYIGEAPKTPQVSVRDDGMTLIDGKPFFPIGLYAVCKREFNGFNLDTAFKGLKESGFNLAQTYGNSYNPEFLSAAKKYGIKLWVESRFPDGNFMNIGRHNPDIIAWYLGDDTSDHISPELEADYHEAVKAVDPTRITVQADAMLASADGSSWNLFSRYASYVTATDGFMPEIYPIRGKEGDDTDKTCVARTIRDMKRFHEDVRLHGEGKARTCWAIMQYFKGWGSWKHFPSQEQLFATTFAAVIHGAHGVTWYTYGGFKENEGVTSTPERWRTISELATRLSELSPVLVERTPPQPPAPEVVSGPQKDPLETGPSVTCLLKRHDGWCYLFAVNASPERVSARLTAEGAQTAEVLYEKRTCTAVEGKIEDEFEPFAVHIYKWRGSGGITGVGP
ncbi:MAG: hypothetical protein IKJ37_06545 [Kiritimatiellae bacterium]|nr:hypothetical protein [Kiritimatiellia bacterium]